MTPEDQNPSKLNTALMVLVATLLLVSPIFRGGSSPLASLLLQWLAIATLVTALWAPRALELSRVEWVAVVAVFLTPVIYLIPLPAGFAAELPGRDLYSTGLTLFGFGDPSMPSMPLSIDPTLTRSAWLALLIPLAVFLATRLLDGRRLLILAQILLATAVFQALLGLVQFGAAQSGYILLSVDRASYGSALGTYANRNHLAGLLNMALPIALAMMLYTLGRTDRSQPRDLRQRVVFLGSIRGNAALAYGAIAVLLLVAIVFTRSRAGISMAMLGLVLTTLLFARRIGGSNTFGLTGTLVVLVIGFGVAIGLAPVLERFSMTGFVDDGRGPIFSATLLRMAELFPFGSGPGTFSSAFPPVQPIAFGARFPNRAHNDYLEWIQDAGALAAILILLGIGIYLYQWTRVYVRGEWSRSRSLQAAAGVSLLLLAFHEIVDYNLAIPANQAVFAFLAAVFLMPPERLEIATQRRRHRRRTPDLGQERPSVEPPPPPPADQIPNPFAS
jgi:O-antigen ligase